MLHRFKWMRLGVLLAAFAFGACGEDEVTHSLATNFKGLDFPYTESTQQLLIRSTVPWTLDCTYVSGSDGWLSFDKTSGPGDESIVSQRITITAQRNAGEERRAELHVTGSGFDQKVTIVQENGRVTIDGVELEGDMGMNETVENTSIAVLYSRALGGNNVYTAFGGGVNDTLTGKALDQIFVLYEKYCNANSAAANLYTTHIEAYRKAVGLEGWIGGNNAAGHTGNNSVYGATGMLKLGTGSALGWLQTPALTKLTAPTDIEVSFSACCWWEDISKSTPSDSPEIKVMVVGPGTIGGQTEQRVQISEKSEMKSYKVRVDGATADTHIEFSAVFIKEGGLTNRWFLDDVLIVPAK